MLAKYLKEIRASKVISQSAALSRLGSGWTVGKDGIIEKEFIFDDHVHASNFMNRYADYCSKVNMAPDWFNVYNRVNIRLVNHEFGGVTENEVSAGEFLEVVSKVRLHHDLEEQLPTSKISDISGVI